MSKLTTTLVVILSFLLGAISQLYLEEWISTYDPPADRYTVAELTDAIATRTATFAERATELEGSK